MTNLWKRLGIVGAAILLVALSIVGVIRWPRRGSATKTPIARNLIQRENQNQGAYNWGITRGSAHGEIQAYASADSLTPGQSLTLYVSTTAPSFTIEVFRLGYYNNLGARLMLTVSDVPGHSQGYYPVLGTPASGPVNCPTCTLDPTTHEVQANWIAFPDEDTITFASDWVSGLYFIRLTESQTNTQWGIPVVLRDDTAQADAIMVIPFNTYEAYNWWGGSSLYEDYTPNPLAVKHAYMVSYNRSYLANYGAQFLFLWSMQLVKLVEAEGINVRYTTDNALDKGYTDLANYRAFLVGGHSEYWSYNMRQALADAIANDKIGVGFFSANSMYWQVRMPDDRTVVCYKDELPSIDNDPYDQPGNPNQYLTTTLWRWEPLNNPEDNILKEMYGHRTVNGVGDGSDNASYQQNMVLTNTDNWAFTNTGLTDGDIIHSVAGYEVDVVNQDGSWGPDDNVTLLSQSPYVDGLGYTWTASTTLDDISANGVLTHQFIFDAGAIDWDERLLDNTTDGEHLRMITWNVIYGLINHTTEIPAPPVAMYQITDVTPPPPTATFPVM